VHERTGRPVVALLRIQPEQASLYGVATVTPGERPGEYLISDLVEKPDPEDAASDLAVIGRYVLPGTIFGTLRDTPPGRGGEIQLTDALNAMAHEEPIIGLELDVPRYDTGDRLGFLEATVALAAEREDLGADFVAWLRTWLEERDQ
jgi:UTP--glucose-1-phosphate uridylyltransferase